MTFSSHACFHLKSLKRSPRAACSISNLWPTVKVWFEQKTLLFLWPVLTMALAIAHSKQEPGKTAATNRWEAEIPSNLGYPSVTEQHVVAFFIPSCTPCLKTSPYLINNLACSVASPSTPQHHTHNQPFISSQGIRIIVNNSIQLCIDCELGLQHRCNNVLHWFPKACEGVWRLHMLDMRRQGEGRTASHNKDWLYVWRQRWLSLIYTAA